MHIKVTGTSIKFNGKEVTDWRRIPVRILVASLVLSLLCVVGAILVVVMLFTLGLGVALAGLGVALGL